MYFFCPKGQRHLKLCQLSQKLIVNCQLVNEIILEDSERVHHYQEQRLDLYLLLNQVPVDDSQEGAQNSQEVRVASLSF